MPFDMPLCRFENVWKGNLNCNICHIGHPPFFRRSIRHKHNKVLIDSSPLMFEIHMCMCVCAFCLFVFFFKSNLSALESKECRLKNQRACRQTNTLKLSRAQRQPNYAKPGGWFIWAHLQSLPVLLSLLFSRVPCCKQQARVEENQPAILWNNREKKSIKVCWLKEPFAWFIYISNP